MKSVGVGSKTTTGTAGDKWKDMPHFQRREKYQKEGEDQAITQWLEKNKNQNWQWQRGIVRCGNRLAVHFIYVQIALRSCLYGSAYGARGR